MRQEFKLKRAIKTDIAVTKLITAIQSCCFVVLSLALNLEPAPGLPTWGKVVFLFTLWAALTYIAWRVNSYFAAEKIQKLQNKLESIYRFKRMKRQIDSFLGDAKMEDIYGKI